MYANNSTIKFCRSLATGSTRVFYIESRWILWSLGYRWLLCIVFLSITWLGHRLNSSTKRIQGVTRTLTFLAFLSTFHLVSPRGRISWSRGNYAEGKRMING